MTASVNVERQIKALRWIDTVHDFFPVNASSARGEDIRDILKTYYGDNVTTYFKTQLFAPEDTLATISPSAVEVQTEKYYSTKFNTINVDDKSSVNIKTIIDKYTVNDATTVLKDLGIFEYAEEAKLQLCLTDRDFFKKNKPATNFLAEVIQRFFFKDTTEKIYFLIDATFGRLDCVFQGIDQASTLINVLSIGDSAVTSVTDKQSKSASGSCGEPDSNNRFKQKTYLTDDYALPYNSPSEKKFNITSNEFTKDVFKLWYADKDATNLFSKANNAAIRLYCQYGDKIWYTEFSILKSGSPNSGASVGILKNLIQILDDLKNDNKDVIKQGIYNYYKANMVTQLNLAPILAEMIDAGIAKETIIKFLFDYKRAGDHEQVNAAHYLYKNAAEKHNVVLLTGDRLCSLYARLIKQPCVYVHDDKYDMYRFFRELSDADKEIAARNLLSNTRTSIGKKIEPYISFNFNATDNAIFQEITANINAYLAENTDNDFYNKCYGFIFRGLLEKIKRIVLLAATLQTEANALNATVVSPDITFDTLNAESNTFFTKYKELIEYLTFHNEQNPEKITSKNVAKFKSNAFGYDNKFFNNVRSYFDNFIGDMKAIRESARDKDIQLAIKINKIKSWGGGDNYESLMEDFIVFVNACLANYGLPLSDNLFNEAESQVILVNIREKVDVKLTEDLLTQTSETYNDITTQIQEFLLEKITAVLPAELTAVPAELTAVPAELTAVPAALTTTDEYEDTQPYFEGGGKVLKNIINQANETILKEHEELFKDIKHSLSHLPSPMAMSSSSRNVSAFERHLKERLNEEHLLFFGEPAAADEEIKEYLRTYLKNLMLLHINRLVDACFEPIYDLINSDEIEEAYEIVYNYIYEVIGKDYSYANTEPYMFIYHLGKRVPATSPEGDLLIKTYLAQLESLSESEIHRQPMQFTALTSGKKAQIAEKKNKIAEFEHRLRRRQSNLPYFRKTEPPNITKARLELNHLKEELRQLENESGKKLIIPAISASLATIPESGEPASHFSGQLPGFSRGNVHGMLHPQYESAQQPDIEYVTTGSKRRKLQGGKFIRTRKYSRQRKHKKTRKLNKRYNKKHTLTKIKKEKIRKYTRRNYRKGNN